MFLYPEPELCQRASWLKTRSWSILPSSNLSYAKGILVQKSVQFLHLRCRMTASFKKESTDSSLIVQNSSVLTKLPADLKSLPIHPSRILSYAKGILVHSQILVHPLILPILVHSQILVHPLILPILVQDPDLGPSSHPYPELCEGHPGST